MQPPRSSYLSGCCHQALSASTHVRQGIAHRILDERSAVFRLGAPPARGSPRTDIQAVSDAHQAFVARECLNNTGLLFLQAPAHNDRQQHIQ
ncbi:hypothetical protein NDU88_007333 [Pleurodeles waltl]|uniref:Uncharacterized protein n=1 Tax=Pleurodeles waltl TaxID=8319 RepID=A0AAV7NWE4_PLEWA|nr:hypothetical protein NDU88_007333 [Pleurodeles waltl]